MKPGTQKANVITSSHRIVIRDEPTCVSERTLETALTGSDEDRGVAALPSGEAKMAQELSCRYSRDQLSGRLCTPGPRLLRRVTEIVSKLHIWNCPPFRSDVHQQAHRGSRVTGLLNCLQRHHPIHQGQLNSINPSIKVCKTATVEPYLNLKDIRVGHGPSQASSV